MKKSLIALFATLTLSAVSALGHSSTEFKVSDPLGRNTVQFKTSAPLEDIVGTTNKIEGSIQVDPKALKSAPLWARFEVDLATLDTGIGLRDTHMRDRYLHTGKYPKAVFVLNKVLKSSASQLKPNQTVRLLAEGSFELHGVERKIQVPIEVTYLPESKSTMSKLPGNLLRIKANFDVRLADHNIERPQMVILKVGEVAHVSIDAFATDAEEAVMSAWMERMKKMMASDD